MTKRNSTKDFNNTQKSKISPNSKPYKANTTYAKNSKSPSNNAFVYPDPNAFSSSSSSRLVICRPSLSVLRLDFVVGPGSDHHTFLGRLSPELLQHLVLLIFAQPF